MAQALLGFVGDLLVNRDAPAECFRHVDGILKAPDVMFGNLEGAYTDDPHPAPGQSAIMSGRAHGLDIFPKAGFDILCLANNHILDVGSRAMLENQARLHAQGVKTCGGGKDLNAAREPAIVEVDDVRIAYLAYASIFPVGYHARSGCPGVAPMRSYDFWRTAVPHLEMSGVPPVATAIPDEVDLAHLTEDIARARKQADLVITSFHWGDQTRAFHLTEHETRTARYCIDHGADMVVGHHHHTIRGMEWYKGKPIMYGIGHFVFDFDLGMTEEELDKLLAEASPQGYWSTEYGVRPRKGWPWLPMHENTRKTMVAWATADKNGVSAIGFLPCMLTPDGSVTPLKPGTSEWDELAGFFEQCNTTQKLNGVAVTDGAVSLAGFATLKVIAK